MTVLFWNFRDANACFEFLCHIACNNFIRYFIMFFEELSLLVEGMVCLRECHLLVEIGEQHVAAVLG